jgi:hypothetical protein
MRLLTIGRFAAPVFLSLVLAACGGGGDSAPAPVPAPTVTLSASPVSVTTGATTALTWSSTNATSCTASGGWTGAKATSGTENSAALTANASFTLTCSGTGGSGSAGASVTVTAPVLPTVTLTANPTSVTIGSSTNLTWSSTNATTCTASGGWTGAKATSGSEVSATLSANTTFTLACTGPGGAANASATVTVTPPLPIIQLSATLTTIAAGGSSTLNWTVQNATSCTASATPANAQWTGDQSNTNGSRPIGPLNATTIFSLSCMGPGGTAQQSVTITVVSNTAPVANAGTDRSVITGTSATLSGAASRDVDGTIASYAWTQIGTPAVTLTSSGSDTTFTAPNVAVSTVLTFQLIVTDNLGAQSAADAVNVTVQPLAAGQAAVSGRITFARIPVGATGWSFGGTTQQPARGITVELVNAANSTVLATGQTDSNGSFSLAALANTSMFVRAKAEMVKTGAAPTWNIRVNDIILDANDNFVSSTSFAVSSANFNSGTGATQNLAIQSGWGTTPGPATGTRDAAPFAVLDTLYRAITKLQTLNPTIVLPSLVIDWGPNNTGGVTFFTESGVVGPGPTFSPKIVLAAQADVDTDEYDAQVVAHEFGHYVEFAFGRSDSIGGPHAFGDRLDPRVAWSEGWGYFWAGFVNDDPVMIDSFGTNQGQASQFNVETNFSRVGWWSESSAWSILWDLYDPTNDTGNGDNVAIGAAPIWAAFTGTARNSEAFTSVFTAINGLKQANQANATLISQINTLVTFHSTVAATLDEFGSTETNNAGFPEVLPVYRTLTPSATPFTVPSNILFPTDSQNGTDNKLGIRHYLRLAGPRTVRITASTAVSTQDPDVVVFKNGVQQVGILSCSIQPCGETGGNEDFTATLGAGTYVFEVYECNNAGCGTAGTQANTNITMTVQ